MKIHKEGYKIIAISLLILSIVLVLINLYLAPIFTISLIAAGILFFFILYFFRHPERNISLTNDSLVYAPADGKVVVIEKVFEDEYFKAERIQISIFMSPTNVHVNRNPIGGVINYFKYHPGKYLVAWHPKSSTENERTSVVIDNGDSEILLRQIAGALAKRIVNYVEEGQKVVQGSEMGFIKFGSRVDLFVPLESQILVEIGDKVKGNDTLIAKLM